MFSLATIGKNLFSGRTSSVSQDKLSKNCPNGVDEKKEMNEHDPITINSIISLKGNTDMTREDIKVYDMTNSSDNYDTFLDTSSCVSPPEIFRPTSRPRESPVSVLSTNNIDWNSCQTVNTDEPYENVYLGLQESSTLSPMDVFSSQIVPKPEVYPPIERKALFLEVKSSKMLPDSPILSSENSPVEEFYDAQDTLSPLDDLVITKSEKDHEQEFFSKADSDFSGVDFVDDCENKIGVSEVDGDVFQDALDSCLIQRSPTNETQNDIETCNGPANSNKDAKCEYFETCPEQIFSQNYDYDFEKSKPDTSINKESIYISHDLPKDETNIIHEKSSDDTESVNMPISTIQSELLNSDSNAKKPPIAPFHTKNNQKNPCLEKFLPLTDRPGSRLKEETRMIVKMLENDKTCKVPRPNLGLQDRLKSLMQHSSGRKTSYVKGPRFCHTHVKNIVKYANEKLEAKRDSFQEFIVQRKETSREKYQEGTSSTPYVKRNGVDITEKLGSRDANGFSSDKNPEILKETRNQCAFDHNNIEAVDVNIEVCKEPRISNEVETLWQKYFGTESKNDAVLTSSPVLPDDSCINTGAKNVISQDSEKCLTLMTNLENLENSECIHDLHGDKHETFSVKEDIEIFHDIQKSVSANFTSAGIIGISNTRIDEYSPNPPDCSHIQNAGNDLPKEISIESRVLSEERGGFHNDAEKSTVKDTDVILCDDAQLSLTNVANPLFHEIDIDCNKNKIVLKNFNSSQESSQPHAILCNNHSEPVMPFCEENVSAHETCYDMPNQDLIISVPNSAHYPNTIDTVSRESSNLFEDNFRNFCEGFAVNAMHEKENCENSTSSVMFNHDTSTYDPLDHRNIHTPLEHLPSEEAEQNMENDIIKNKSNREFMENECPRKRSKQYVIPREPTTAKQSLTTSDLQRHIASLNKVSKELVAKQTDKGKCSNNQQIKLNSVSLKKSEEGELLSDSTDKEHDCEMFKDSQLHDGSLGKILNPSMKNKCSETKGNFNGNEKPSEMPLDYDCNDKSTEITVDYAINQKGSGLQDNLNSREHSVCKARINKDLDLKESEFRPTGIENKECIEMSDASRTKKHYTLDTLKGHSSLETYSKSDTEAEPDITRLKTDNLVARHCGAHFRYRKTNKVKRQMLKKPESEEKIESEMTARSATDEVYNDNVTLTQSFEVSEKDMNNYRKSSINDAVKQQEVKLKPELLTTSSVKRHARSRYGSVDNRRLWQSKSRRNTIVKRRYSCLPDGKASRRSSQLLLAKGTCKLGSNNNFSQGMLKKCLEIAIDKCASMGWEAKEEESSDIAEFSETLSYEELNKELARSVSKHNVGRTRELLKLGADPNTNSGHTPVLLKAVKDGALYIVQALLAAGAETDARLGSGDGVIHLAARGGHSEIIIELVHSGAYVDAINRNGVTPLQTALAYGRLETAQMLLRLHADILASNKVGETALEIANHLGYVGLTGKPKELRRDSAPGTRVETPSSDIPVAVKMIMGIEEGCAATVEHCLALGAGPNTIVPLALHWPARAGVLHRAAHHGEDLIAKLLLRAGADINMGDFVGNTPLHAAAQAGHNKVVKVLLANGADLESISQSGMTPLHRAASKGKDLTCNMLLKRGANPKVEDNSGCTPADWARKRGFKALARKLFYRRRSSCTLLAETQHKQQLKHLSKLHQAALKACHQQDSMDFEE